MIVKNVKLGVSYGIVNPCQELITQWINLTYMERSGTFVSETNLNLIWALVVGSVSLGALAGALLVRVLSERCGRRNALIINGIFNIIGAFCELIARSARQTARYATLAIGVVYFLFACSAPLLIDRVGRRPLSLFQLIACLIALSLLTLFTGIQQYGQATWASYGTIGALVLYMCVYGVGSPIPWMITGELFNQHFRSTAVTVSVFVAYLMATIISSAYLPFQQMVGVTFSYMPFIVVSCISIVVLYFILPETKNRDVNDIVNEARARNHSLSVGLPWNAVSQEGRTEMKKLLDDISEGYSSISN
ncbi:unnamed protein product, partial [Mesorhabditis belari]|uniref:Major facilitator superfamily (MFS) profile domain-containing protein n=1 Tax=Mesorhabditis belari TaxID=2138241 RepID=A0AAF3FNY6_9BILA